MVDRTRSSVSGLLTEYSEILTELRRRGVVRTNNAPAGDYGELLVAAALDGALADDVSAKSFDMTLPDGRLVQVKTRVVSDPPKNSQVQTSPFRSWGFDLAAFVLLNALDYQPTLGVLAPVAVVQAHAKHRAHVNGHIVFIRPPLTMDLEVLDITVDLRRAAGAVMEPPSPPVGRGGARTSDP